MIDQPIVENTSGVKSTFEVLNNEYLQGEAILAGVSFALVLGYALGTWREFL